MKKIMLAIFGVMFLATGYCIEPVYTEKTVVDKIEVLEDGQIQVRRATKVYKDGVEISKTYKRHIVTPIDDISREDLKVQAIASVVHTPEVKSAYIASKSTAIK